MPSKTASESAPFRIALFMSLGLGHRTQFLNWQRVVNELPGTISPTWVPVESGVQGELLKKLPLLPTSLRRNLSEWVIMRRGFRKRPFDAVMVNPHSLAMKHLAPLARQPYFLCLDVTRRQFNAFSPWYHPAPSEEGPVGRLRLARQRRALQGATGIFSASRWTTGSLIHDYQVDPARVHTVPIGIDTQLWRPADKPSPQDGTVRILFIGGSFQRKGGDLLLRWARQTSRRNWELHLVTEGPGEPAPGVHYHRASNNSQALIGLAQRCNFFVLPTRADCSPLAILEAMATGLPVISTRVGGIPEMIDEGVTGYTIPRDDYDALHGQLDSMVDAPPEKLVEMGKAARQRIIAEFNAEVNVRRTLSIMQTASSEQR
jgi:glycosyltransferase involved in cell wall biosynthesis